MFPVFARWLSRAMGTPMALLAGAVVCVLWLMLVVRLHVGVSWQVALLTNIPTLVTALLVIVVQHTQNHHNDAAQIKLDEIIRAIEGANNVMVHLEELSPEELERVRRKYGALAERVRAAPGGADISTSTPNLEPEARRREA